MENSAHAIKIILGVIVFGLALTIALNLFSQIRRTSQSFLFADEKEYSYKEENVALKKNRVVGLETVILTIFNYHRSDSIIYLKKGKLSENTGVISNITDINLYKSARTGLDINCFDYEEEKRRGEIWTSSYSVDTFLSELLYMERTNKLLYTSKNSELYEIFCSSNKKRQFIELQGTKTAEDGKTKKVIDYILIE